MIVKLEDLQLQFPGLFNTSFCTTASEAEHHADVVAAELGLTSRAACWAAGTDARNLQYQDHHGGVRLNVIIDRKRLPKTSVCWFFQSSVERLDVQLHVDAPSRVKAQAFQQDVRQLVARLRSLAVQPGGRVTGQLKKWNQERGYGYLECAPGVRVYLNIHDVSYSERPKVRYGHWFSFAVQTAPEGQKAKDLRRCVAPQCDG
jgi:cold shock CspA family protein